LGNT